MAQTKTDYGLIYNTDDSVCTTVRPDQIPFPGVNSFAVETATTNLVTNSPQQPPCFTNVNASWGRTIVTSGSLAGWVKINITNTGTSRAMIFFGLYSHPANETRTYAIDAILPHDMFLFVRGSVNDLGSLLKISNTRYAKTVTPDSGGSYGIYIYSTLPANTTGSWDVYVRNYQIEQKPFASSFVVGSRPSGRLVISVEDLKFDIANDDWVISYWKYPVATQNDTQDDYNICSLGRWTSDESKGYIWWGKVNNTNKYRLEVVLNDATYFSNINDNTFNPTDYFFHWHYEVVKKWGKTFSYYVDGVKQCELIIPADKELQTPFDVGLSLGGHVSDNIFVPNNLLISYVGGGRLKAEEFTDEHIQAIYAANKAFASRGGVKIY